MFPQIQSSPSAQRHFHVSTNTIVIICAAPLPCFHKYNRHHQHSATFRFPQIQSSPSTQRHFHVSTNTIVTISTAPLSGFHKYNRHHQHSATFRFPQIQSSPSAQRHFHVSTNNIPMQNYKAFNVDYNLYAPPSWAARINWVDRRRYF